jgi:hypothetical protein
LKFYYSSWYYTFSKPNNSNDVLFNVWAIMPFDTHFLELKFLDYDSVKPFKSKFGIQNMFFYMILKCIACVWFIKSCPKPFQNATYEWNFQIKLFWPTFNSLSHNITNWQILQSRLKVGFKKGSYNFWNFQKLQHITFDAFV